MLEKSSIYTDDFQDQFNDVDFYANPKKTKVHLKIQDVEHVIGNSIVFNIENSNEQIPVYAYNSPLYAKYLRGKNVITGMIAFRKTTVDRMISMIQLESKKQEIEDQLEEVNVSMTNLKEILENAEGESEETLVKIQLMFEKKQELKRQLSEDLDLWYSKETIYDTSDDMKDLLYLRDQIGKNDEISFRLVFESNLSPREETIKDILFVKKSQDVSVDKSDVIEIYQFIGNPVSRL